MGKPMRTEQVDEIARKIFDENPNGIVGRERSGESAYVANAIRTWATDRVHEACGLGSGDAGNAFTAIHERFRNLTAGK